MIKFINKKRLIFISIILILTIYLRFLNLDKKIYTSDEVRGIMRFSGYQEAEFVSEVYNGNIITVEEIQKYQLPNRDKNIGDAWNALAGNPEHPPLYYMMSRFVSQWLGNPVGARILAVLFSLLTFPCLYWLCLELFQSHFVAIVAIAIFAASPFHFRLAQEAREYSLWTVATLASSASLLKALRLKTTLNWVTYGASVALGMYSHLFFVWVGLSHCFYVLIREKLSWKSLVSRNYLLANLLAIVVFSPWVVIIINQKQAFVNKTKWARILNISLESRLKSWLTNLGGIFVDFENQTAINYLTSFLIFILVVYSMYFFNQN